MATPDKDKDEKDRKVPCTGCGDDLEADHTGIKCDQGHSICSECSQTVINLILSEPQHYLPAKCPTCQCELASSVIERQLNSDQLAHYIFLMQSFKIADHESLQRCPFCRYFEIWPKDQFINFFFCKHPDCEKMSCSVCFLEIQKPGEHYYLDEESYLEIEMQTMKHFTCAEFKDIRERWENALEMGQKMYCPNPDCKVGGRKDEACTHMTCDRCHTRWCYFCGKSEADCDKEDPNGDIYSHNAHWHDNELRCPMYFTELSEVDPGWPDDDTECLGLFHRLRTIGLLRQILEDISREDYQRFAEVFASVKTCGFSYHEILRTDTTLIHRQ